VGRAAKHLVKARAALANAEREFRKTVSEAVTLGRITDHEAKIFHRALEG
jgi:hypothetical protein